MGITDEFELELGEAALPWGISTFGSFGRASDDLGFSAATLTLSVGTCRRSDLSGLLVRWTILSSCVIYFFSVRRSSMRRSSWVLLKGLGFPDAVLLCDDP